MTDFTGGTWRSLVDGSEVVAIPDSVIAQYDATQESSTGSITSIDDQIGSFNLSGNCEVISSGINGKKTYRFDGTQEMSQSSTMATTEPFAIIAVIEQQEALESNNIYYDGGGDREFAVLDRGTGGSEYRPYRGGSGANNISGSDTGPKILTSIGDGSNNHTIRKDSSELGSGSGSSSDLTGLIIANDGNTNQIEADYGELVVLEDFSDGDIEDEEQRLAEKWGISI